MLTVRRVYLYLVAAISLTVVTWAVIALARLILSEGIGQGQITGLRCGKVLHRLSGEKEAHH